MSVVFLVYSRSAEGDEPLVALTRSQESAEALEACFSGVPGQTISWEEFPLLDDDGPTPGDVADGDLVHVVSLGGLADDLTQRADDLDPIGLGVFSSLRSARTFAERQPHQDVRIRTLPIGWLDDRLRPAGS